MRHEPEHLARATRFILSRSAGRGDAHRLIQRIREVYPNVTHTAVGQHKEVAGYATISVTTSATDVTNLAREWADWHADGLVVVAGGDGSVSEAAGALAETGVALGVIPMGTGNDFARGLYDGRIDRKFAFSLASRTRNPQIEPIDLLEVNGITGINLFSLGWDTEILKRALALHKRFPKLGGASYVGAVFSALHLQKITPLAATIVDDSGNAGVIDGEFTVFVVGNGKFYGSGYQPLPHAKLDDGLLDILAVDPVGFVRIARLVNQYRTGAHIHNPRVQTRLVREVIIERPDGGKFAWNIDGHVCESECVEIRVKPGALNLARLA